MNDNSKTFLRQMNDEEIPKEFWAKVQKTKPEGFLWRSGQTEPYSVSILYRPSADNNFKCVAIDTLVHFQNEYGSLALQRACTCLAARWCHVGSLR